MKKITAILFFVVTAFTAFAQCPMCKMVAQSAQRESGKGLGLNDGIMYLFALPYLSIMVIGILWYRTYKKKKLAETAEL